MAGKGIPVFIFILSLILLCHLDIDKALIHCHFNVIFYYLRQGGYVFCLDLFVSLFVNKISQKLMNRF